MANHTSTQVENDNEHVKKTDEDGTYSADENYCCVYVDIDLTKERYTWTPNIHFQSIYKSVAYIYIYGRWNNIGKIKGYEYD